MSDNDAENIMNKTPHVGFPMMTIGVNPTAAMFATAEQGMRFWAQQMQFGADMVRALTPRF